MAKIGCLQVQITTERISGEIRSRIVRIPINCTPADNMTVAISPDMTELQCALAHLEAEQEDDPDSITDIWLETLSDES